MSQGDRHASLGTVEEASPGAQVPPPGRPTGRTAQSGVRWLRLLIWGLVMAVLFYSSPYPTALAMLIPLVLLLTALFNGIYIAAARLCGLYEVEEFAVGLSPTLVQFCVRGVRVRFGGLVTGGYVKFPGEDEAGQPRGYLLLHPLKQAAILLSPALAFTVAGWFACNATGAADIVGRAARWVISGEFVHPESWAAVLRAFLTEASLPRYIPRSAGLLVLFLGIANLIPAPVAAGGIALKILMEFVTGRRVSDRVWNAVSMVTLLAMSICAVILLPAILRVVLRG